MSLKTLNGKNCYKCHSEFKNLVNYSLEDSNCDINKILEYLSKFYICKKRKRWDLEENSIIFPLHYCEISESRWNGITRIFKNGTIQNACLGVHCDKCFEKYRKEMFKKDYINYFNPFVYSGMCYIRSILIEKLISLDEQIPANKDFQKHLEISHKEFTMIFEKNINITDYYKKKFGISIPLVGIVDSEHYKKFHMNHISDIIAGHPMASNGWMWEAMNNLKEMNCF